MSKACCKPATTHGATGKWTHPAKPYLERWEGVHFAGMPAKIVAGVLQRSLHDLLRYWQMDSLPAFQVWLGRVSPFAGSVGKDGESGMIATIFARCCNGLTRPSLERWEESILQAACRQRSLLAYDCRFRCRMRSAAD